MSTAAAFPAPMISPVVLGVFVEAAQVLKPPPKLTITEWAERERRLSSETSAAGGRYRVARAPYQREMQDAVLDPDCEEVVYFTSAQVGKSVCIENIIGYFMREDPCPIIMMWPTLEKAKEWATLELDAMLRDTPALRDLTQETKNKKTKTLLKRFPGGALHIVGAQSTSALRAKKARVVLGDEVDEMGGDIGGQGDAIKQLEKRQTTFWNRKRVLSSTGTIKGDSRIEAAYEASSKGKYWVPCPHCSAAAGKPDGFQILNFRRLIFDKTAPVEEIVATYPCEHCGVELVETDKRWMLANGEWRHEQPKVRRRRGYWINEMWSPFTTWSRMAGEFLEAIRHREDTGLLKAFVNLSLGETWEDEVEKYEPDELLKRAQSELYPPPALPDGVTICTAGVDVQDDRLKLSTIGFGKGGETWVVDRKQFDGNTAQPKVWQDLDEYLLSAQYMHARGILLPIAAVFIDSGFRAQEVYNFTKSRNGRRIFASKGIGGFGGRPPLMPWNRNNKQRAKMYPIGVDVIKETIYSRLGIGEPGAGYIHFAAKYCDKEYFAELTAEELKKKYVKGYPVRYYEKKPGARNEALDEMVYANAAFLSLSKEPDKLLERCRAELVAKAKQAAAERRAKHNPDQMSLLIPAELQTSAQELEAEAPAADVAAPAVEVETKPAEDLDDQSLGEHEYKVAETLDAAEETAPPPPVLMQPRRSRWI